MRELMQRKKLRLMAAVLSLFMILGLVSHISGSASGDTPKDPLDITEYVNVSLKDFYFSRDNKPVYFYKDGMMVEGTGENYTLRTGEKMKVAYAWDVPAENMSQVANGKYFKVKIPSQDALLFDNLGELPIPDIGSFVIEGGYIKVTFNGNFEGKESIKDGKLELNASLSDKKFDEIVFQPKEADAGTKVTFTVKTHENQKPTVDPGVNPGITDASANYSPLKPKGDLVKEGSQLTGGKANYIEYTLRVNYEAIKDTYKKGLHNLQFGEKQNVYLIDEMPDDLVVKPSTAHISVYTRSPLIDKKTKEVTEEISSNPLYHATVYSSVQNNQIKYGKKLFFDIVEKSETEVSFEAFKKDILEKPNRTIGFWNGNKIVVKIGTLPLNDLHYEDGYAKGATEFSERVDRYLDPVNNAWIGFERQLNAKQVEYVKKAYIGKPIVNFTLRYQASPKNKLKSDTSFMNKATMFWDEGKSTAVEKNVLMRSASGSATMEPFKGKYLVTKKWLGTKQSEVQVQLYKDDAPQGSPVTLNDSNGWKHEFTGLNNNGGTATFTVKEVNPPAGYRSVVVPVEGKYASVIENYEQVTLKLRKKWLDNGSALADPAVEKVIFYLHDADEPNPDTTNALHRVELSKAHVSTSEANVWEKEITVDKTDAKGKVYDFKVTEAKVAGFTQKGVAEGDITTGFTITNEKNPQIDLTLTKKWLNHKKTEIVPDVNSIRVSLHNNDVTSPALQTVDLSKSENWTKTIKVNKLDDSGTPINYVVAENQVAGFKKGVVTGNAASGFIITNEKEAPVIEKIDLTLTKKWLDHTKADLANPAVEEVTLYLHDKKETAPTESNALQTVVLKKTESWTKTVEVNKQNDNGEVIEYVVSEKPVPGFKKGVVTGNAASGFIITNEKEAPVIQKINLKLTKKWIDHTNADLANPAVEEVTLYLHNKKEATPTASNAIQTVVLKKSEGWTKTVELNQKDSEGADIEYVVSEKPVSGFEKGVVSGEMATDFVITNKKEAPAIEKINLKLTKKWLDKGAVLADPGLEKVTFYLHDAKETNRTESTALYVEEITKAESWTKTVSVNKKDDKGADIVYVVSEKAVDGFNQKGVTVGNHTEGFTITNEKIPPVAPYYPYYPIYIPVPEVPSVVPNTPAGETPAPPTPPAPNVPNDPVNEVPETPEVPEVVTVEDEDEEDIEVIGDNTPRGDTDIEEDEPKTRKKKKDSDKDVNLDDDSTPRGRKNILAKTGGLKTTFIPFAAMLAILALAFAAVQVFVRKKR